MLTLFTGIAAAMLGATYHVAPSGNDANDGSSGKPWATVAKAFGAARAGDTVYFHQGEYAVTGWLRTTVAGTAQAPMKFASYPGERAELVWDVRTQLADATTALVIWPKAYQTFERLTIRQTEASRAYAISIEQRIAGVSVWSPNVTIRDCSILNMSGLGIYTANSANNFLVEGSTLNGMDHGHAFYIAGPNGVFRNNTLDCTRAGYHKQCIQLQYTTSVGNKVYGNLVTGGAQAGVVFSGGAASNEVFNNIFVAKGGGSVVSFWPEAGVPVGPGNKFYNNTVIGKAPGAHIMASYGEMVEIFNNIFNTGEPAPIGGGANYKISNNVFFNVTGTVPAGNIAADPKLTDPAGTTAAAAKIKLGSSALNKATSAAPSRDYFGLLRPLSTADIGAHEYDGVIPPLPNSPTGLQVR